MMGNFAYSGGLWHMSSEAYQKWFFQPFSQWSKICFEYQGIIFNWKKVVDLFQKFNIEFYKTKGGGSKAVYKLYKKQAIWYWMASLRKCCIFRHSILPNLIRTEPATKWSPFAFKQMQRPTMHQLNCTATNFSSNLTDLVKKNSSNVSFEY